jgi:hypothetical protein
MALAKDNFALQSDSMNPNWAEENLQTIRTLMERSALYRHALAPVMMFAGSAGILGGIIGWRLRIESDSGFVLFWSGIAALTLAGAFILVRRQAVKDSEPFWSPPTKRVAQALVPAFTIGAFVAAIWACGENDPDSSLILIPIWCWAYGCAICSAGFFVPRGMKWFGWLFILSGFCLVAGFRPGLNLFNFSPHLLMGGLFGGLHLAYGIYLYFTEKKNPVA